MTGMERILYDVKKIGVGQDHFLERALGALPGPGNRSAGGGFGEQVHSAWTGALAQGRRCGYDAGLGLYRGETSFLDWREQS